MTDIYALLNRAIDSQPDNSPETRQAVYNHIRSLYERQRQGIDPTLPPEEIQAEKARLVREQASLETIIARIEAERSAIPGASDDVLAFDRYSSWDDKDEGAPERNEITAAGLDAARERPRIAARRELHERSSLRKGSVIAVIALVLLGIGGVAWWLRHDTSSRLEANSAATDATDAESGKIADRVGGAPPDDLPAGIQPAQPVQQSGVSPASAPSEMLAQRAFLLELNEDKPEQPTVSSGQVLWRLEGKGSRTAVLYADISLPEAGLSFSLAMRPNDDASLPASHTIEIDFDNDVTAPTRVVRDIAMPQLRTDKEPRGVPLVGLTIPVADNTFLIGLSNVASDMTRNYGLLKERDWVDIPVRFANGVVGTITFAKGSAGKQVITEALESWE